MFDKRLNGSLEHLLYIQFMLVYFLDESLLNFMFRCLCQLFQPLLLKSQSLRSVSILLILLNLYFIIRHLNLTFGTPIILDFITQDSKPKRFSLILYDLFIVFLQLIRNLTLSVLDVNTETQNLLYIKQYTNNINAIHLNDEIDDELASIKIFEINLSGYLSGILSGMNQSQIFDGSPNQLNELRT
ncbi:hypothetical protein BC833DRAFT_588601, partial [Globomyces pollinis-pini]